MYCVLLKMHKLCYCKNDSLSLEEYNHKKVMWHLCRTFLVYFNACKATKHPSHHHCTVCALHSLCWVVVSFRTCVSWHGSRGGWVVLFRAVGESLHSFGIVLHTPTLPEATRNNTFTRLIRHTGACSQAGLVEQKVPDPEEIPQPTRKGLGIWVGSNGGSSQYSLNHNQLPQSWSTYIPDVGNSMSNESVHIHA